MELGGKDVCIVCADADLDLAAKSIVKGAFSYSGQRCTAVKLVAVVKPVADALIAKVSNAHCMHTWFITDFPYLGVHGCFVSQLCTCKPHPAFSLPV